MDDRFTGLSSSSRNLIRFSRESGLSDIIMDGGHSLDASQADVATGDGSGQRYHVIRLLIQLKRTGPEDDVRQIKIRLCWVAYAGC